MKRYLLLTILSACLLLNFSVSQAKATLVSTFDSGTEGWTISDGARNLTWNDSGGNFGGFISAEENLLNNTWFFRSPLSWGGDWSCYIGGTVSFDIIDLLKDEWDSEFLGNHGEYYSDAVEVVIAMDANNKAFWHIDLEPNADDWTNFQVQLLESSAVLAETSTYNFQTIMGNVNRLAIRGEYFRHDDREGLDNVVVAPVPEPASMLLLGAGLVGLAGFRRKFRKR